MYNSSFFLCYQILSGYIFLLSFYIITFYIYISHLNNTLYNQLKIRVFFLLKKNIFMSLRVVLSSEGKITFSIYSKVFTQKALYSSMYLCRKKAFEMFSKVFALDGYIFSMFRSRQYYIKTIF